MIFLKQIIEPIFKTIKLTYLVHPFTTNKRKMVSFVTSDYVVDKYNGVNVDLDKIASRLPQALEDPQTFNKLLKGSIKDWNEKGYRAIWFNVKLKNSNLVPILVENGFDYHHARSGYVTMTKWISDKEPCNIPSYPYTNIGVGGLVVNNKNQVLVVKEKYNHGYPQWKFPGGYAIQGEDFSATAVREIFEETGVKVKFESVIALRHSHRFQFKCSDIYFVCYLRPEDENNVTPVCDLHEITDVAWIDHDTLLPVLSNFNAFILSHFMAIRDQKAQLRCQKMDTLIGKVDVYFVDKDNTALSAS